MNCYAMINKVLLNEPLSYVNSTALISSKIEVNKYETKIAIFFTRRRYFIHTVVSSDPR